MRTTATEAEISRSILDYLAAEHVFALRLNSGMRVGETNGKKWAIHMAAAGTADILAFPLFELRVTCSSFEGTYHKAKCIIPLWIEVKDAKGKQSELQKSFQAQVEREGHRYVLARSIDDVMAALK